MQHDASQVLVLSPHRDDAAFSCGLLLSALLRSGANIFITNIFTRSAYAPYLPATQEHRVDQVTLSREQEDAQFCEVLAQHSGASPDRICLSDLGWKDAPIRRELADEQVLETSLDPGELRLLADAFAAIRSTALVLVPAGIGGHVDHLLVHHAARQAFSGNIILFYEDLPYACWQPIGTQHELPRDVSEWLGPLTLDRTAKRDFAICYASQIAAGVAEEMQEYANGLGGRERFFGVPEAVHTINELLHTQGTPVDHDSTPQLTT